MNVKQKRTKFAAKIEQKLIERFEERKLKQETIATAKIKKAIIRGD